MLRRQQLCHPPTFLALAHVLPVLLIPHQAGKDTMTGG
jgi:hypothetical protein